MINALSFDVEDYFQVHAFERVISRNQWDKYPNRVMANTRLVLKILDYYHTRATFFILGWVAERHPILIREIAEAGHEIATHGYEHKLVYRQTPAEFSADLSKSLRSIYNALLDSKYKIKPIIGYRAPAFSITRKSIWALKIIKDFGLKYDSSIFPLIFHNRYGMSKAPRFANQPLDGVWEFPVSTLKYFGLNWPVGGGGYFRLFPLSVTCNAINHLNRAGQPALLYFHPWEFDPYQPKITQSSMFSKFRHYTNLHKTERRLRYILDNYNFGPICEVFYRELGSDL